MTQTTVIIFNAIPALALFAALVGGLSQGIVQTQN